MCSKLLSFLVSVLLCRNVLLCFWATVSALVCLVCSSTVVQNYDDEIMMMTNGPRQIHYRVG